VITVDSAFQIHPVIATRWAGNLGKKSKKLIMIMVSPQSTFSPSPFTELQIGRPFIY
jgi:hypothetical protein